MIRTTDSRVEDKDFYNINLNTLVSQQDSKTAADIISQQIMKTTKDPSTKQGKQQMREKLKTKVNIFLDNVNKYLENRQAPLQNKFYTLLIFRYLSDKTQRKILSLLSGNVLFAYMVNLANTLDPYLPIEKKGRNYFSSEPEWGNRFIRLVLECLVYWGEIFAQNKTNGGPSKFRQAFNSLIQHKVVIPRQFKYFKQLQREPQYQSIRHQISIPTEKQKIYTQQQLKYQNELRYIKNKIDLYMTDLDKASDQNQMLQSIKNHRKKINQQIQKNKPKIHDILQSNHQNATNLFYKLIQYLEKQQQLYNTYITAKKDYHTYNQGLQIQVETIFAQNKQMKPLNKQLPFNKNALQPPPKMDTYNTKIKSNPIPIETQKVITSFLKDIQSRSKSPGFNSIKDSISHQKKNIMTHPPRPPRKSQSPINKTQQNRNKSEIGLRQSKISHIFNHPPNPNVQFKNFDGRLVTNDPCLQQILYDLHKEQGVKKFKISNLKSKNSLFENQHIQIGYKSEAVYQSIHTFQYFIALQIFIGNKTDIQIRGLKVQYKGDSNQLLYAHPRQLQSIIPSGFQNKQELMIVPLKVPFAFLRMRMQYEYKGQQFNTVVVLPNSIMKLAKYHRISKGDFFNLWKNGTVYKSQIFPLSEYLAPQSFQKFIPQIQSLTKYSEFEAPGSVTDYELCCSVTLLEKYNGVMKITIRPNLQVIIQVSVTSNSSQAGSHFQFYIQTLHIILHQFQI